MNASKFVLLLPRRWTMAEPVKLSRERWDALCATRHPTPADSRYVTKPITITSPIESRGITFLPAEYVPGGSQRIGKVFKFSPNPCA